MVLGLGRPKTGPTGIAYHPGQVGCGIWPRGWL
jgi:hypothetical protein